MTTRERENKRHRVAHGEAHRTAEYRIWKLMKRRCLNPNHATYKYYGGRGVKVCERWLHNFPNFLADVGRRPSAKHTLDRIDNAGDYAPDNCRWVTMKTQCNNRRVQEPYWRKHRDECGECYRLVIPTAYNKLLREQSEKKC